MIFDLFIAMADCLGHRMLTFASTTSMTVLEMRKEMNACFLLINLWLFEDILPSMMGMVEEKLLSTFLIISTR